MNNSIHNPMNIQVKNMNCRSSVCYVEKLIQDLDIPHSEVTLNKITFHETPSDAHMQALEVRLNDVGLEFVLERRNIVVEKIKSIVRTYIAQTDLMRVNMSDYLSEQLDFNYSYLSNLFAEAEGTTIRDFGIALRIERAKNMLVVEKLDLLEISIRLRYSSVAHLAAQFKKVTGMTSSEYKRHHLQETHVEKLAG
jgi:AraC-like DNA-binding protein